MKILLPTLTASKKNLMCFCACFVLSQKAYAGRVHGFFGADIPFNYSQSKNVASNAFNQAVARPNIGIAYEVTPKYGILLSTTSFLNPGYKVKFDKAGKTYTANALGTRDSISVYKKLANRDAFFVILSNNINQTTISNRTSRHSYLTYGIGYGKFITRNVTISATYTPSIINNVPSEGFKGAINLGINVWLF